MTEGGSGFPRSERPPPHEENPSGSRRGSIISTADTPVRELLARYRIVPRKRYGQNFLHDPRIARRIVDAAGVRSDGRVLEIGPGLGALTAPLLETGADVTAVEVDERLATCLRDRFGEEPRFRLVTGDVLSLDVAELAPEPVTLVANVPYAITGPILALLIDHPDRFPVATLMVQREVARRIVAPPGGREIGAPAVLLRLLHHVERRFDVGRGAFSPRPDVISTVVGLARRPDTELPVGVREAVNTAYRQRRKTLRRTLAHLAPESVVSEALEALGYAAAARPEALEPDDWPRLVAALGAPR